LSPRRRLLFALVGVVVVALGAVVAVREWPGSATALAPDQPGTVLLVPGFGGDRTALEPLADRIRADGKKAVVLTLPGDGTGDLMQQTQVLNDAVNTALTGGTSSVDIVGYSAGGVVARLWVANNKGRAQRVVTMGSPLHGTTLAAEGGALAPGACPTACQQLTPGSAVLAPIAGAADIPWVSIWTEDDQTVTPPDSARLPGAVNVPLQQVCPGARVSHEQLPTDPRVIGLVLDGLTGTAPTECPKEGVS
jgi:triacylglycerol esterase/lipase EstA (alpha/beta hydrolase family)